MYPSPVVKELPSCSQCGAKGDDIKKLGSISLIDELSIMAGKGNSELSVSQLTQKKAPN